MVIANMKTPPVRKNQQALPKPELNGLESEMSLTRAMCAALVLISLVCFSAQGARAQDGTDLSALIEQDGNVGTMNPPDESSGYETTEERIIWEPFQMTESFITRNDLVFLMRHGPTDWSRLDDFGVGSADCAGQRIMTDLGRSQMTALASWMALLQMAPGEILVSEWCRNQQTLDSMLEGFEQILPGFRERTPVDTDPAVNLLLSLNGAPNVTALRQYVLDWEGSEQGPLLIITHFTNIQELTEFRVYEGEILVLDPKLSGRVLGYVRLASAGPDRGHFSPDEIE